MIGRAFTQQEEATSGATDVAIVSYSVWKRLLGGDPHVVGKTIRLTDYPFRIVGVMPPGFEHVSGGYRLPHGEAVDVWLPFNMLGNPRGVPRAFHYCNTVARLKPGVTLEEAQAEMNVSAAGLEAQYPDDRNWRIQLKPLQDDLVGGARPTLLILAGAVGLVLLIACVNVANLAAGPRHDARAGDGDPRRRGSHPRKARASDAHRKRDAGRGGRRPGAALRLVGRAALVTLGPEGVPRLPQSASTLASCWPLPAFRYWRASCSAWRRPWRHPPKYLAAGRAASW